MPSTYKTENYLLNSWIGSDKPMRSDFVSDNEIIDENLARVDACSASALSSARQNARNIALIQSEAEYAALTPSRTGILTEDFSDRSMISDDTSSIITSDAAYATRGVFREPPTGEKRAGNWDSVAPILGTRIKLEQAATLVSAAFYIYKGESMTTSSTTTVQIWKENPLSMVASASIKPSKTISWVTGTLNTALEPGDYLVGFAQTNTSTYATQYLWWVPDNSDEARESSEGYGTSLAWKSDTQPSGYLPIAFDIRWTYSGQTTSICSSNLSLIAPSSHAELYVKHGDTSAGLLPYVKDLSTGTLYPLSLRQNWGGEIESGIYEQCYEGSFPQCSSLRSEISFPSDYSTSSPVTAYTMIFSN